MLWSDLSPVSLCLFLPGIGVPIMLAYVYGVVPISLCRSGGCGVSAGNGKGVRIEFDDENDMNVGSGAAATGKLCCPRSPTHTYPCLTETQRPFVLMPESANSTVCLLLISLLRPSLSTICSKCQCTFTLISQKNILLSVFCSITFELW